MTQQIKLMYVDDKLDMLLIDYLNGFEKDDIKIVYDKSHLIVVEIMNHY